jgi:hypothetical protein
MQNELFLVSKQLGEPGTSKRVAKIASKMMAMVG